MMETLRQLYEQLSNRTNDDALRRHFLEQLADADREAEARELLQLIAARQDISRDMLSEERQDELTDSILLAAGYLEKERMPKRIVRWRWAAAAMLMGVLATGAYFLVNRPKDAGTTAVVQQPDIAPGSNKAFLTLADGSRVSLDSAGMRVISEGAAAIKQQGGSLQYMANAPKSEISYNTLTTPRGGQFHLVLSDGTEVWLNAASSIHYPTIFSGNERKVTVSGEVYFQVAANARMPFRVNARNKATVEVLGTGFNVNAYDNEESIKTTLLEGSVRVNGTLLKPGQQAQLQEADNKMTLIEKVNINKVVSWKNGLFDFEGATLQEVMRQLERWYDIEVVYEKGIPDVQLIGKMTKGVPLSGLLENLGALGLHYRLDGRILTVLPSK